MATAVKPCLNARKGKHSHLVFDHARITSKTKVVQKVKDNHGLEFDASTLQASAGRICILLTGKGHRRGKQSKKAKLRINLLDGTLTITLTDPPLEDTIEVTYVDDPTPER